MSEAASERAFRKPPAALVFVGLLVLWQLVVWFVAPPPIFLPSPIAVGKAFLEEPNYYLVNAGYTLENTIAGFALAVVIGISLAVGIVYSRFLEATLYTSLVALNSVPKVALAPLFVTWLGTGNQSKVGMAFMIAIFAIVIDAVLGLRTVDPDMLDLGRSLRGSPTKILLKIRFPSALPSIFAGMKVAISLALVGTIVGEFVAAQHGLGYVILSAEGVFETTRVFVALVLLAIMGTVLFYMIEFAEQRAVPWHVSRRSQRKSKAPRLVVQPVPVG